jgi:hypothetical protein
LEVLTDQVAEKVVMEPLRMGGHAGQPALDRPLIVLENLAGGGHLVHPLHLDRCIGQLTDKMYMTIRTNDG